MICPWFGAHILSSIRQQFPNMIILHYMDAILIYGKISIILNLVLASVSKAVQDTGFEVAVSKIQCTSPWKHLGLRILERIIISQPLDIKDDPRTLREFHPLCGSINWVHSLLGITTEDLMPLFQLLKGSKGLDSL